MSGSREISAAGILCALVGAVIVASALYKPFDPNYCIDGCGIMGNLIPKLMGMLNSVTGPWGPRIIYFVIGAILIVIGWQLRVPPKKNDTVSGRGDR